MLNFRRGDHLRLVGAAGELREIDDVSLVHALRAATTRAEAARETVRRFAPMINRILKRSLGPRVDLPDLVQEVFLRLFSRINSLRDPQAFKQFIISITVNVLKWEMKRSDLRRLVGLSVKGDDVDGIQYPPDHDGKEAFEHFHIVLRQLKSTDRTLFVLRYLEELTLPEVAAATSVSLATAKRRLDRVWAKVTRTVALDPVLAAYLPDQRPNS